MPLIVEQVVNLMLLYMCVFNNLAWVDMLYLCSFILSRFKRLKNRTRSWIGYWESSRYKCLLFYLLVVFLLLFWMQLPLELLFIIVLLGRSTKINEELLCWMVEDVQVLFFFFFCVTLWGLRHKDEDLMIQGFWLFILLVLSWGNELFK